MEVVFFRNAFAFSRSAATWRAEDPKATAGSLAGPMSIPFGWMMPDAVFGCLVRGGRLRPATPSGAVLVVAGGIYIVARETRRLTRA